MAKKVVRKTLSIDKSISRKSKREKVKVSGGGKKKQKYQKKQLYKAIFG